MPRESRTCEVQPQQWPQVPWVWDLDQQADVAQGRPARLPEREPWGPRGEQEARYRNFSVDICRAKSVPLGLQVTPLDGFGLEVAMVKAASPVAEWNRKSATTFPEDALRPGGIITRVKRHLHRHEPAEGDGDGAVPFWAFIENCELLIIVRCPFFQRCQL